MCYNSKIMLVAKRPTIPSIMLAKLITYNSQSYAGTLGSGLVLAYQCFGYSYSWW